MDWDERGLRIHSETPPPLGLGFSTVLFPYPSLLFPHLASAGFWQHTFPFTQTDWTWMDSGIFLPIFFSTSAIYSAALGGWVFWACSFCASWHLRCVPFAACHLNFFCMCSFLFWDGVLDGGFLQCACMFVHMPSYICCLCAFLCILCVVVPCPSPSLYTFMRVLLPTNFAFPLFQHFPGAVHLPHTPSTSMPFFHTHFLFYYTCIPMLSLCFCIT